MFKNWVKFEKNQFSEFFNDFEYDMMKRSINSENGQTTS